MKTGFNAGGLVTGTRCHSFLDNTNRSVLYGALFRNIYEACMEVITAIKNRRAAKSFDPHHKMSEETRRVLLEMSALAPSAYNIQHWRIVDVQDPAQRAAIREVAWGQARR